MNFKNFINFVLVAVVLLGAFSCKPQAASVTEDNHVTFDTVSVDTICRLVPEQEQPYCHFRINMARPIEAKDAANLPAIQSFIVNLVKQGMFAGTASSRIDNMVRLYTDNYIEQYRRDGLELLANYKDQPQESYSWLSYEEIVEGKPLFNQFGFLSYQISTYTYAGGAHGVTTNKLGVLDLKTLYPLNLLDIFDMDVFPMVNEKIQQQLMKDNDCKSLDELANYFIDPASIAVTDNFSVDFRGINWMYDPYEIAPYAMGAIRVSIPWTDLRQFILPESPVIRMADYGKNNK